MIEGIRHTGIVVNNLQKASEFYLALGCKVKAKANEEGRFIEKVTGIKNVNIEWIKMVFDDGNLLELIQYNNPKKEKNLNKQPPNQIGISHIAFNVKNIENFCKNIVELGGSIVNEPAITNNKQFKVAYCHDIEGNLLEVVETQ
tara:strand:- start:282 stop:713 length:432 start_codon:yes stop_codon:yes gene_type:complete